ncbi:MAG: AraC family transcriptional regulator [Chryseolinea sp.]
MIQYRMHKPHGVLAQFVRFFWSLEAQVGALDPFIHRALPDNCVELIFYCKGGFSISSLDGDEGRTFASGVFGQAQKFRQFKAKRDFSLFGVYLYPYTLKILFNLPANDVSNEMVKSETLWGIKGKILEEQIMLAKTAEQRVQIVSNFFLERVRAIQRHDQTFMLQIKSVVDNNNLLSIASFAHDCNLSRRQFERKFNDFSGLSPKDFFSIVRFKNVLREIDQIRKPLAQIAIDNGYYDQSHLTNEFKKFSGYSPREYFTNYAGGIEDRVSRDFIG